MHTALDCYPCALRQALEVARHAGLAPAEQRALLFETMAILRELEDDATPPQIAQRVHRQTRLRIQHDRYASAKRTQNEVALGLLPRLRERIATAADPFELAVRYSVAGNVIDLGVLQASFDVEQELREVEHAGFARWDLEPLRRAAIEAQRIVLLTDNAGEIAFDRLLVEQLGTISTAEIAAVVRGSPILNDATLEDARRVGLDEVVPVISNESDAPGTLLTEIGDQARALIMQADLVISKGQGNYESLSRASLPIVFLLKAKCAVLAEDLGVPLGSFIVAMHR